MYTVFDDVCVCVCVQGSGVTEHPLGITWVEHIIPTDGLLHSIQNM